MLTMCTSVRLHRFCHFRPAARWHRHYMPCAHVISITCVFVCVRTTEMESEGIVVARPNGRGQCLTYIYVWITGRNTLEHIHVIIFKLGGAVFRTIYIHALCGSVCMCVCVHIAQPTHRHNITALCIKRIYMRAGCVQSNKIRHTTEHSGNARGPMFLFVRCVPDIQSTNHNIRVVGCRECVGMGGCDTTEATAHSSPAIVRILCAVVDRAARPEPFP